MSLRPSLVRNIFYGLLCSTPLLAVDDVQNGAPGQSVTATASSGDATNNATANGGSTSGVGQAGGNGTALAQSNSLAAVSATSNANGGSGGEGPSKGTGNAGAGGTANAQAEINGGSLGATLTGNASARGGAGGTLFDLGFAGGGGLATSTAAGSSSVAASLSLMAQSQGGAGGLAQVSFEGYGGGGGSANAAATGNLTTLGGQFSLTALATGGNSGTSVNVSPRNGGGASASVTGTSAGTGTFIAEARAGQAGGGNTFFPGTPTSMPSIGATVDGTALGGSARALAASNGHTGLLVRSLSATVEGSVSGQTRFEARVNSNSAAPTPAASQQGSNLVTGSPLAGNVGTALAGNPNASLRLGTGGAQSLVLAQFATSQSALGPQTITLTSTAAINLGAISAGNRFNLQLGLLNPSAGNFTSLTLTVTREGSTVLSQTFNNPAAATAYFTDNVLDFGPLAAGVTGTLDLQFALSVTGAQPGDGFRTTLLFSNAPIPEPATLALVGLGGLALGWRLRRQRVAGLGPA